jgi:tetratricopeptide (TPR) repeat protein
METETGHPKVTAAPLLSRADEPGTGPQDPGDLHVSTQKKRIEELILWGSWERAREELFKMRSSLVGDPRSSLDLELIDRRIKEVGELSGMTNSRLRDHLERGQFYFNNFEYSSAVRLWLSDSELSECEEVKSRVAFAQGLIERLEVEVTRIKSHLDRSDPEAALAALAAVKNLDPKRSRLWSLERNAQNLLTQKRVDALKSQVLDLLAKGDQEGAVTLLAWIGELSQHILTVRWIRRIREEMVQKLTPEFERCLGAADVQGAEKIYRWVQRLNSEGVFDGEVERLRRLLSGLPPAAPNAEPPRLGPIQPQIFQISPQEAPLAPAPAPAARRFRVSWAFLSGAAGAVLLIALVVHQTLCLIHVRSAERLSRAEQWEEAEKEVAGARGFLLGGSRVEALRKQIVFRRSLDHARDSLRRRSWQRLEEETLAAAGSAEGIAGAETEIRFILEEWKKSLLGQAQSGDSVECCAGFDRLEKVEKRLGESRPGEEARYGLALNLARALIARGRYAEAISLTRRAQTSAPSTPEAAELLGELRSVVREAAEQATSDGKFDEARELYRLLNSQFPAIPADRDSNLRRLEFLKTLLSGKQALEGRDLREAEAALEKALDLKPGDAEAQKRLEELVAGIAKLRGRSAGPGDRGDAPARADLAEAVAVAGHGYRIRVPAELTEVLSGSLYGNNLRGQWILKRDPSEPQKLLLDGKVILAAGEWISPVGDLRIGVLYLNDRGEAVTGQVTKIPLLLPGAGQEFQFKLPAGGSGTLQVGIGSP